MIEIICMHNAIEKIVSSPIEDEWNLKQLSNVIRSGQFCIFISSEDVGSCLIE